MANIPHVQDYGAEFELHYNGLDNKLHFDGSLALEKGEVIGKYFTIDSTVANQLEGPSYTGANSLPFFGPCAFSGAYYNPACWAAVIAQARNIEGKEPPAMPNLSGSLALSYDFDLGPGVFTPWIQYVYRGAMWARIFNEPSLDRVPAYGVTNLNFSYVPTKISTLKISLAITNLFNTAGINSQYTDPYGTDQTSRQYIPPRQVIGTIAYAF
jgi:iron complex outermembrane receptor protein